MKAATAKVDIATAISYIDQHGCEGLTVSRLVRETQRVPAAVFLRAFRSSTGMTAQKAILRRQLDEARRLLVGSELSLNFIAGHCGFRNLKALEKALITADGRTAAQLRRKTPVNGRLVLPDAPAVRRPRSARSLPAE